MGKEAQVVRQLRAIPLFQCCLWHMSLCLNWEIHDKVLASPLHHLAIILRPVHSSWHCPAALLSDPDSFYLAGGGANVQSKA
jgi:hypothetical protein